MPKYSWIIAAFNEEKRIAPTLVELDHELDKDAWEIIVSDDGSVDRTVAICKRIGETASNLRVIENPHRGRGSALRTGLERAGGAICVFSSADLVIPRHVLEEYLDLTLSYDLVLLSKNMKGSRVVGRSPWRELFSKSFSRVVKFLFSIPYEDTQGIKIGRAAPLMLASSRTHSDDYLFDLELVVRAYYAGLRIIEVPWSFEFMRGSTLKSTGVVRMVLGTLKLRASIWTHHNEGKPLNLDSKHVKD